MLPILFAMDDAYNDPWYWGINRRQHHPHFGLGVTPAEIQEILHMPVHLQHQALADRRQNRIRAETAPTSVVPIGKDGFQVCMDVAHFKPNEITVKTVDSEVIIEGKHEEREDQHGFIARRFTRRYTLPKGYDPNSVTSSLSSDGVLTVKAPKPKEEGEANNERVIPIHQTGPAHLNVAENKAEGDEKPAAAGDGDK